MTATKNGHRTMVPNSATSTNKRVVSVSKWTEQVDDTDCTRQPHQRRRKTVTRQKSAGTLAMPITIQHISDFHGDLLPDEGIFRLNHCDEKLPLSGFKLKRLASELASPWTQMGIAFFKNEWLVHMPTFKTWYARQVLLIRHVPTSWDANYMLQQDGVFYLQEVCSKLPFKNSQIRHQVRRQQNLHVIGVWKEATVGFYLVEMPRFSAWVRQLWV